MKNNRSTWMTLSGFILFTLGFAALGLMIVGVQFQFLTWIDAAGKLVGLLLRLLMIISGIVLVVLAKTDWSEE